MHDHINSRGMVQRFIQKEALRLRKLSHNRIKNIATIGEWLKTRENIKNRLLGALGGIPEKTELKSAIINKVERKGYSIENIVLESLPGIQINLNLYLPKDVDNPIPAVIFATGHTSKLHPDHQNPVQGLVRNGYAVATFDCYGRGERTEGNEHFEVGPLCWLNGNNLNRYFINDSIRVVDYLYTRREIDKEKIACTGISGGGNTTIFHAALDERVKCAVPVCTIASFSDYINLDYYSACPEFYPSGLFGYGIDIQDIICLIAPRPFMFIGGGKDVINSMPSLREACRHAEHIYKLYGVKSNISYFIDEKAGHSYTLNMRRKMNEWMNKHSDHNTKASYTESSKGEQETLEEKETVEFISCSKSNLLQCENGILNENMKNWDDSLRQDTVKCVQLLKKLLGLDGKEIKYKKLSNHICRQGLFDVEEKVIETEEEIYVSVVAIYPSDRDRIEGAVLVIADEGKDRLLSHSPYIEYAERGYLIAAADLRGTGDSRFKSTPWDHYAYCSADRAVSGAAIAIGYPVPGQQVYDALAVLELLNDSYDIKDNLIIIGEGHSGILAKLVYLFKKSEFIEVNCNLLSYVDFFDPEKSYNRDKSFEDFDSGRFKYKYSDIIPGILQYFDL